MHQKVNVLVFFNICPKSKILEIKIKVKFDHSLVLSFLYLYSPNKNSINCFYSNNIYLPWALAFSTRAPLLYLPLQVSLDFVCKLCKSYNMSFGNLELRGHFDQKNSLM